MNDGNQIVLKNWSIKYGDADEITYSYAIVDKNGMTVSSLITKSFFINTNTMPNILNGKKEIEKEILYKIDPELKYEHGLKDEFDFYLVDDGNYILKEDIK